MRQFASIFLVAMVVLTALSGCGAQVSEPQPLPQSSQPASSAPELTSERIPAVELSYNYYSFEDTIPDDLPKQLIIEDETAYRLALTVRNYLFIGGNRLGDFNGQLQGNIPGLLETVIYHTNPINLVYSFGEEGFACEDYPNHVIAKRTEQLVEQGIYPSVIVYAEDVKNTAIRLFGQTVQYEDANADFFEYFPQEGVYIQPGDLGGARWPYPIITSYSKTEDGYVCEATLVTAIDQDTPIEANGVVLTKDNFAEATAESQKHRYHFTQQQDGTLILTGLETLS